MSVRVERCTSKKGRRRFGGLLAAVVAGALSLQPWRPGLPATLVWDGGSATTNQWSVPANWNPNQAPQNGDFVNFAGSTRPVTFNDLPNLTVQRVHFLAGAASFTLNGNAINLGLGLLNDSSLDQFVNLSSVSLTGSQVWGGSPTGALVVGSEVRLGSHTLTAIGGTTRISGKVGGTGALALNGLDTTLVLSGNNTFSGGTRIAGGTLEIGSDAGLGAMPGSLTIQEATLRTTGTFSTNRTTALGNSPDYFTPYSAVFDVTAGTTFTHNGTIQNLSADSGSLVKAGAGTLVLGGNNTYSGITSVKAGVLRATNAANLGSGGLRVGGGTFEAMSTFTLDRSVGIGWDDTATEGTFRVASGTTLTVSGRVADSCVGFFCAPVRGTLIKIGAGTLVLTHEGNAYSGGTRILGGRLRVAADGPLGTRPTNRDDWGRLTLDGGTLETTASFNSRRSVTIGANGGEFAVAAGTELTLDTFSFDGTGSFVKSGAGTLTLQFYPVRGTIKDGTLRVLGFSVAGSGDLVLDGGRLRTSADGGITPQSGTGDLVLTSAGGEFSPDTGTRLFFARPIRGAGALTKTGGGRLVLGAENSYSGGTLVREGTLVVRADAALGTAGSPLTLDGGTLGADVTSFTLARPTTLGSKGGVIQVDSAGPTSPVTLTHSGIISGKRGLTKEGIGVLVLTGSNTYLGGTYFNDGIVQVSSDGGLGDAAGALTFDGGVLRTTAGLRAFNTMRNTILLSSGTFDVQETAMHGGVISGSGSLIKTGNGTLTLLRDNTYTGETSVRQGALQVASDAKLGAASATLAIPGGTLRTLASFATSRSTYLQGQATIHVNTGTTLTHHGLLWDRGGGCLPVLGCFPSGSLHKRGGGTLALTHGDSGFLSAVVAEGTLRLDGALGLRSHLSVQAGARLEGSGRLQADLLSHGIIAPGASAGTLTVKGDFALYESGTLELEIGGYVPGVQFDQLLLDGVATLAGALDIDLVNGFVPQLGDSFVVMTYGSRIGQFSRLLNAHFGDQLFFRPLYGDTALTLEVAAVPEPSTWALMLAGLGALGWLARRRSVRQRFLSR